MTSITASIRARARALGAAALAALALAAILIWALSAAQAQTPDADATDSATSNAAADSVDDATGETTISVRGAASRSLTTDQTTISFTVTALNERAQGAVQQAELALAAVTTRLRWMSGVDHERLFTRNVSLREEFDWTDSGRVSRGYRYNHSLTLTVEGTDGAGEVIDAIVSAGEGSVEINDVSFSASTRAATERQVLLAAIRDARATAEAIAAELGKSIVDTTEIAITNALSPVEFEEQAEAATADTGIRSAAPQIRGGQEDIQVSVNATFLAR